MPYRVIVTGCRHWVCPDLARSVVARLVARHGPIEVIQGGASGVDESFAEAAWEAGYGVRLYQAEWEVYGKRAGPVRNGEMVADGADMCLAVHRDLRGSKGTKDCVRQALGAGIPCYLIDSDEGTPKRLRHIPEKRRTPP